MKKSLSLLLVLFSCLLAGAQSSELGLSAGVALYRGELSAKNFLDLSSVDKPALGFQVRFSPYTRFSGRLGAMYAQVSSAGEYQGPVKGLNFRSTLYDAHLLLEWNVADANFSPNVGLTPYLFGGIGGCYFQSQALFQGEWIDLQPLGTEGQGIAGYGSRYNQLHATLPLGLGLRLWLGERLSLLLEGSARVLFTDYLDDVSDRAVVYEDILEGNGATAAALSNPDIVPGSDEAMLPYRRGDARRDGYYFLNLTVTYRTDGGRMGIRVRKNCPTF